MVLYGLKRCQWGIAPSARILLEILVPFFYSAAVVWFIGFLPPVPFGDFGAGLLMTLAHIGIFFVAMLPLVYWVNKRTAMVRELLHMARDMLARKRG